jgi:TRAP-type C4-dicarboxylate transport system permease small subunit
MWANMTCVRAGVERLHVGTNAISRAAAYLASLVLVLMTAHIIYEIMLRVVFSTSTFILDEIVGYGVAACTFLALGYALERGGLIRVNLLMKLLGDDSVARRAVEFVTISLTLSVVGLQIAYFWRSVVRNFGRGAVSETVAEVPLWIPEGVMLLGLAVFCLHLSVYLLRTLVGLPLIRDGGGKK